MVAKPARIKQSDVTRILKGAKAAGVEMSIIVTAEEVRFVPVGHAPKDESNALKDWIAKRDARRASALRDSAISDTTAEAIALMNQRARKPGARGRKQ